MCAFVGKLWIRYLGFFGDALQSYTCSLVAPGKDAKAVT